MTHHAHVPSEADTQKLLTGLNRKATHHLRIEHEPPLPFGAWSIQRYRLGNGLRVLLQVDHSAPVISYNTWFRVGSRHEKKGKTGLAHLFEHLMFNETKALPAGRFDKLLERAGAETNAATWTDWTYYYENIPSDQLALIVKLEAERMHNLVLRDKPVASEKEVVANERRYRVDDDIEGTVNETLWAHAFEVHPYHHPTIGWMKDIQSFTPEDCRAFYKTFYAPNNATIVLVGDLDVRRTLMLVRKYYGGLKSARIPDEEFDDEPGQNAERSVALSRPTPTEKVSVGYKCPGFGHEDHAALSVLAEVLTGGRSSRFYRDFVTEKEIATDVSGWASTFRDPGLIELTVTGREGVTVDRLLHAFNRAVENLTHSPITPDERDRAVARMELTFLRNLETVGGRAEQIGFFDTVLGDAAGGFVRLEKIRGVTTDDLRDVVRRYMVRHRRTVVVVRSDLGNHDEHKGRGR